MQRLTLQDLEKYKGFTPGPWSTARHQPDVISIDAGDWEGIATIGTYGEDKEGIKHAKIDAELIAAAPLLLENLREALKREEKHEDHLDLIRDEFSRIKSK